MRLLLVVLAILLALPAARAASDTLSLDVPASATLANGNATIPVHVALHVEDFACPDDRTFVVTLTSSTDGDITASAPSSVTFAVPGGTYMGSPYDEAQDVTVNVTGSMGGNLTLVASFAPDAGDCVAMNGFPTAQASRMVAVTGGQGPAPAPAPGNDTTTNTTTVPEPTNTSNETAATNTTHVTTNSSVAADNGTSNESPNFTCPTPDNCGYAGGISTPQQSTHSIVPGAPIGLVIVAAAGLALWRKR